LSLDCWDARRKLGLLDLQKSLLRGTLAWGIFNGEPIKQCTPVAISLLRFDLLTEFRSLP
jgi:hypothetical protein